MKKTRAQQRERPGLAMALVLPCAGKSRKVRVETYFALMNMLSGSKHLTDLLVCWMHRNNYTELLLEVQKPLPEGELEYRVTLKSKEKRK